MPCLENEIKPIKIQDQKSIQPIGQQEIVNIRCLDIY